MINDDQSNSSSPENNSGDPDENSGNTPNQSGTSTAASEAETAATTTADAGEQITSETSAPAQGTEGSAPAADAESEHKWYVVHTYSGYEQKARLALKERIRQFKMEKSFGDVLIPSENVIELVRGEKKTTSRKFFPGYMLVKMHLTDPTWHLVKSTPKITGFVGNALTPPSVPDEEVARITNQMAQGTLKPRPKVQFEEGESVRVIDGPFVNFNGVVEEVKPDKGKLRVLVSIFGRSTPVELDFVQVEKN